MTKFLLGILSSWLSLAAFGAPFLIADVSVVSADQCVYTRTSPVVSAVVVDMINGLSVNGYRVCKVDLASDPLISTVTIALRDSVTVSTGPYATYTFPVPPTQGTVSG